MATYSIHQVWRLLWRWRVSNLHHQMTGFAITKAAAKRAAIKAAASLV